MGHIHFAVMDCAAESYILQGWNAGFSHYVKQKALKELHSTYLITELYLIWVTVMIKQFYNDIIQVPQNRDNLQCDGRCFV